MSNIRARMEAMETVLRETEHEKRNEWGKPPDVEAGMKGVADGLPALHAGAKHGDLMVCCPPPHWISWSGWRWCSASLQKSTLGPASRPLERPLSGSRLGMASRM